jgi:hypothetical protein
MLATCSVLLRWYGSALVLPRCWFERVRHTLAIPARLRRARNRSLVARGGRRGWLRTTWPCLVLTYTSLPMAPENLPLRTFIVVSRVAGCPVGFDGGFPIAPATLPDIRPLIAPSREGHSGTDPRIGVMEYWSAGFQSEKGVEVSRATYMETAFREAPFRLTWFGGHLRWLACANTVIKSASAGPGVEGRCART